MCYVHNQWYDISCATLYYTNLTLQKHLQQFQQKNLAAWKEPNALRTISGFPRNHSSSKIRHTQ